MQSGRFHRSRAAVALEMAHAAPDRRARNGYLSLWREWTQQMATQEPDPGPVGRDASPDQRAGAGLDPRDAGAGAVLLRAATAVCRRFVRART